MMGWWSQARARMAQLGREEATCCSSFISLSISPLSFPQGNGADGMKKTEKRKTKKAQRQEKEMESKNNEKG